MCCREGVDKAPKAPKGVFVSVASLADTSSLPTKPGLNKTVPTRKPSVTSNTSRNGQDIETVDLAGRRDSTEYARNAPREFRKLHQLHEKVTAGSSTPLMTRKKPTFDFKIGDQPQIPFLDKAADTKNASDNASTDYDDEWMDGLPSLSALLAKQDSVKEPPTPHEKSTDYGSDWKGGLPSLSALLHQDNTVAETAPETDSLEEFDPSQSDEGYNDLEGELIPMGDLVAIHEDARAPELPALTTFHRDEATANERHTQDSRAFDTFERPKNHAETSAKSHVSEKLFLSTDSPEKQFQPRPKREATVAFEYEDVSLSAPVPKRSKVSDEVSLPLHQSSIAGNEAPLPVPKIRPEQPAWVYDFDPAFIAEWQDFVDFV